MKTEENLIWKRKVVQKNERYEGSQAPLGTTMSTYQVQLKMHNWTKQGYYVQERNI